METIIHLTNKRPFAMSMGALLLVLLLGICTSVFARELAVECWVARYNGPMNLNDGANAMAVDSAGNIYVAGESFGSGTQMDYATVKYAPDGTQLWVVRYNGDANDDDSVSDLAVGRLGNIYVTGTGDDSLGPGPPLPGIDRCSYGTVKYAPGGSQLWAANYTENLPFAIAKAFALAVDSSGNVYVTGYSRWPSTEYTTIKYNPGGNQLWKAHYSASVGTSRNEACDLAVDNSGNVYVTGVSYGSSTQVDYVTVKYTPDGNQLWTARYNGDANRNDWASALAIDNSGDVYVTGSSDGNGTGVDFVTIKYSPDSNQPLWVARYNGPGNGSDRASALAVDGSNNIYVTGDSNGVSGTGYDFATIKYGPDSNQPLWEARYNGPGNGHDEAKALAIDDSGNIYVTGCSLGSGTDTDFATVKYSPNGNRLWVTRYNGPGSGYDEAYDVAADNSGNIYVTGKSKGTSTSSDYATIKYKQLRGIALKMRLLQVNNQRIRIAAYMPWGISSRIDRAAPLKLYPGEIEFSNWSISWGGLYWPFRAKRKIDILGPFDREAILRAIGPNVRGRKFVLTGKLQDGRDFFGRIFIDRSDIVP